MPKQRLHTASPFPDRGPPPEPHPLVADWLADGWEERPLAEKHQLRTLDALLKGAEARGHTVGHPKDDDWPLWLIIRGERVNFRLREHRHQRKVALTKDELRFSSQPCRQILVPSGYLVLQIEAHYSSEKDIYERKRQLEDCIEQILDRCEAMADRDVEQRNYWADRERRLEEKRIRRERDETLAGREEERWERLRRMARERRETEILRIFVDTVAERMKELKERPRRVDLWLDWARERIDELDPFLSDAEAVYRSVIAKPGWRKPTEYELEFGEQALDGEDE